MVPKLSVRKIVEKECPSCHRLFHSRRADSAYCSNECRERGMERTCAVCSSRFYGHKNAVYCSRECELKIRRQWHQEYATKRKGENWITCQECGRKFSARYGDKRRGFCSSECSNRFHGRINKRVRRAKLKSDGQVDRINPLDVYERDGWVCGICGKKVIPELEFPHPRSASLDHIIPLSRGGEHTLRNVQLAHF